MTQQDYIQLAQNMEANGITCAGIGVWGGYGNNANNVYNEFAGWFQQFMAIWPPTGITMKNRFAGVVPPPPTPKPPATNATGLSHGVHSVNPSSKQVTFVGQTFAGQSPTPNNVVNFRWSATRGAPTATYVGNVVSDVHGNYSATVPLHTGSNFFWIVLGNGKSGRWTTDNVYI